MRITKKMQQFAAENRDLFELAQQEIPHVNYDYITISAHWSKTINFEGYVYRFYGAECSAKDLEELKSQLEPKGYTLINSVWHHYTFRNEFLYAEAVAKAKVLTAQREKQKQALIQIKKNAYNFLFTNYPHVFVRYGKIPNGGQSYNFRDEHYEDGVSVFNAVKVGSNYYIDVGASIFFYMGADDDDCYEVTGELLDSKGSDGEPLLKNASIVRKANHVGLVDHFIAEVME